MPHTRSAKKRLKQNEKRRMRNRAAKSALKTFMKRVEAAIEANELDRAWEEYRIACKKIDKAAARRIMHPNNAARKKSKLAQRLAQLVKQHGQPSQ